MAPPASPHVSMNISVDVSAARAYLASLPGPERPTLMHLPLVTLGRTLAAFPAANARVVGHKVIRVEGVGAALPVNLLGHAGESRAELGMVVIDRLDSRSLVDVASRTRRSVGQERGGRTTNRVMQGLLGFAAHAPSGVLELGLDAFDLALRSPRVAEQLFARFPATTVLSNVGAVVGGPGDRLPDGVMVRAAHISPPHRLVQVATVWGAAPVQDEVVPVAGRPEVRPMLPLVLVFDHRALDGVIAARVLGHLARLLLAPAEHFGPEGERTT